MITSQAKMEMRSEIIEENGYAVVEPAMMYCAPTNEPHGVVYGSSDIEEAAVEEGASTKRYISGPDSDFVRQPCKARGVVIKPGQNPHVARYAYIDIPVGTRHGTVLSCCHPVCIASGRRFRYCAHCETAVAKRNFNVRHAHGSLNSPPSKQHQVMSYDSEDSVESKNESPQEVELPGAGISVGTEEHRPYGMEHSSSYTSSMALTMQEVDFINLLRSRHDCDEEDWKAHILYYAQQFNPPSSTEEQAEEETRTMHMHMTPSGNGVRYDHEVAIFMQECGLDEIDLLADDIFSV